MKHGVSYGIFRSTYIMVMSSAGTHPNPELMSIFKMVTRMIVNVKGIKILQRQHEGKYVDVESGVSKSKIVVVIQQLQP